MATKEQIRRIYALGAAAGLLDRSAGNDDNLHLWVKQFSLKDHISELTEQQADFIIRRLEEYRSQVAPLPELITEEQQNKVKASQALTLLLAEEGKLYYYEGEPDYKNYASLKETTYDASGLRKLLLSKNYEAVKKVRELKEKKARLEITEEECRQEIASVKSGKDTPTVIIKATDKSTYKNLIDALDEMQICSIGKYVIVDITDGDQFLIDNYLSQGELSQNAAGNNV